MAITTYKLPSGAEIEVQSTLAPPARQGVDQASALDKMTAGAWNEAMERVAELADQAIAKLEAVTKSCKEVAVEFGVSIGGKTGVILVEGTVNANLKVTLKW
jgi:hypothetical protein